MPSHYEGRLGAVDDSADADVGVDGAGQLGTPARAGQSTLSLGLCQSSGSDVGGLASWTDPSGSSRSSTPVGGSPSPRSPSPVGGEIALGRSDAKRMEVDPSALESSVRVHRYSGPTDGNHADVRRCLAGKARWCSGQASLGNLLDEAAGTFQMKGMKEFVYPGL